MSLQDTKDQFILENITRNYGGSPEGAVFGSGLDIWDFINPFEGIFEYWGVFQDVFRENPVIISEIPQTWEELEEELPELFEPILETRPGEVPDPYPGTEAAEVILGDPTAVDTPKQDDLPVTEEWNVAHDWGHWIRESLTGIATNVFAPTGAEQTILPTNGALAQSVAASPNGHAEGACEGMVWSGGAPPKGYKVVNYCGQGVLRKVRRRRRRRLLTASDSRDIATIVGLVGKGQMASALINRR